MTGHSLGLFTTNPQAVSGVFSLYGNIRASRAGDSLIEFYEGLHFGANKSNGLYGNSVTVQPH